MGLPMAGHLLSGAVPLVVHNRTKAKAQSLLNAGATWAASPAEAAAHADVVFICVTDTPDVEDVLFGPAGVAHTAQKGLIVVDHSTISPTATKRFAAELTTRNIALLDAPVSGGDVGAKNATLSIMIGGDRSAFDRVQPLLEMMGKTITHCGPSGSGQLTKLVNQVLVTVTNLAVCEALTLAAAGGLDLERTIKALSAGAAGSWQLSNLGPKMVAGDYRPGFMIDLQHKDLRLVLEAAKDAGLKLNAAELVAGLFSEAQNQGRGQEGTQALYEVVRNLAKQPGA